MGKQQTMTAVTAESINVCVLDSTVFVISKLLCQLNTQFFVYSKSTFNRSHVGTRA